MGSALGFAVGALDDFMQGGRREGKADAIETLKMIKTSATKSMAAGCGVLASNPPGRDAWITRPASRCLYKGEPDPGPWTDARGAADTPNQEKAMKITSL